MRFIENCKLVQCVELPLKLHENFKVALNMMLNNGLAHYLERIAVPLVGNWTCRFYISEICYSNGMHNLMQFTGPLHISLNSRENILLKFHAFFAELYSFLCNRKKAFAKRPKPWRIL